MKTTIAKEILEYNNSREGEDKAVCELLAKEISACLIIPLPVITNSKVVSIIK